MLELNLNELKKLLKEILLNDEEFFGSFWAGREVEETIQKTCDSIIDLIVNCYSKEQKCVLFDLDKFKKDFCYEDENLENLKKDELINDFLLEDLKHNNFLEYFKAN